jgi:signal transduction histidine kinase
MLEIVYVRPLRAQIRPPRRPDESTPRSSPWRVGDRSRRVGSSRGGADQRAPAAGAVSIQLTALDSRVAAGDPPEDVSERIGAIHRLVGDGLLEARNAVRALRDEGLPLVRRLRRLCDFHGARFIVTGQALSLRREATHALYRVAQEALTNAAKHAPGGAVSVSLNFGPDGARIRIDNERSDVHGSSPLASAGGGYGLAGLRERVQLAGGRFHAGPSNAGWRVSADVGIQCGSHGRGG